MRNKNPDDLSVQEIRFLLVDKRRSSHNIRLDRFRKTGQVLPYVGHLEVMEDSGKIVIPTPGSLQAIRIQIPSIHVDSPVVQGNGWEQLKKGVAQHIGTPDPGEGWP